MLVLDDAVVREGAVGAARGDHGDFALEVDEGFEDASAPCRGAPTAAAASASRRRILTCPLPSYPKAAVLRTAGAPTDARAARGRRSCAPPRTARQGHSPLSREIFFSRRRFCVTCRRSGPGEPARCGSQRVGAARGDVLELEGHDVDARWRSRAPRRGRRTPPRPPRRRPGRWACRRRARRCGRGSPCARAAIANMRPSCPLPRTPTVEPGGIDRSRQPGLQDLRRVCFARKPAASARSSGRAFARIATARRPR